MSARNFWADFAEALQLDEGLPLLGNTTTAATVYMYPIANATGTLKIGTPNANEWHNITLAATTITLDSAVTVNGSLTSDITGTVTGNSVLADNGTVALGTGSDVVLTWNGTYLQGGGASGFTAGMPSKADANDNKAVIRVFDDFIGGVVTDRPHFTFASDGGTGTPALRTDTVGGVLNIVTAAADNDYHGIVTSLGAFDFLTANKPFWARCRFRIAEAATNNSAVWFGVTSDLTTGGLQADAAGPLATYDGVMIWKDEGTMETDIETSNAGTQNTEANTTLLVDNTWTEWAISVDGTATTANVKFYVDGTQVGNTLTLTRAGLVPGALVLCVKAGPGGDAETLQIDFIEACQVR